MVLKQVQSPRPTKDDAGFRAAVEQAKLSLSEGGYVYINHSIYKLITTRRRLY